MTQQDSAEDSELFGARIRCADSAQQGVENCGEAPKQSRN